MKKLLCLTCIGLATFLIARSQTSYTGSISANQNAAQTITAQHFGGTGTAPTVLTNSGAGLTGGTVSFDANASDTAMYLTVSTGLTPAVSSTIAAVTFNKAFPTVPHVEYCPANLAASQLSGVSQIVIGVSNVSVNGFNLTSGTTGLTGSSGYIWCIHVFQ